MILRIITGVIGILIAAVVIQFGGVPFVALAILLSLVGWHEFSSAFGKNGIETAYIFGALSLLLLPLCAWIGNTSEILAVLTCATLLIFLLTVFLGRSPVDSCVSVAGILYIGLPFVHLIWLRFFTEEKNPEASFAAAQNLANSISAGQIDFMQIFSGANFDTGCALIWILFACTWASDTFAYFVGSAIGSHKLASSISPNKTIEGFMGSLAGTTLTGVVVGNFLFGFPLIQMAVAGFILAIVATLGDLVESVIKRFTGIKDSGFLIPGHGGVLDRFDSIFYTAPVFYYFVVLSGIV